MKKIMLLTAMVLFAVSAQAVSLLWGSVAIQYSGTTLKNNTNVSGYLLYIAEGTLASSYVLDSDFSVADIGTEVHSRLGTPKSGKTTGTFQFDYGKYVDGDSFALIVSYNDGTDTYWNLSTTINTLAGIDSVIATPTPWTDFAISDTVGSAGTLVAGGGWTTVAPVPEPATGLLALAGVAMLIRRKRA